MIRTWSITSRGAPVPRRARPARGKPPAEPGDTRPVRSELARSGRRGQAEYGSRCPAGRSAGIVRPPDQGRALPRASIGFRCSRPRTKNPHNRPFRGMPGRHPERRLPIAPGDRRSLPAPPSYTGFPTGLVWFHSGGLSSLGGACLHGRGAGSQVTVISCSRRYPITCSGLTAGRTSVPARVRRRARTAGVVRSRCRAGRCGKSLSSRT
jgi:hypothetical protein